MYVNAGATRGPANGAAQNSLHEVAPADGNRSVVMNCSAETWSRPGPCSHARWGSARPESRTGGAGGLLIREKVWRMRLAPPALHENCRGSSRSGQTVGIIAPPGILQDVFEFFRGQQPRRGAHICKGVDVVFMGLGGIDVERITRIQKEKAGAMAGGDNRPVSDSPSARAGAHALTSHPVTEPRKRQHLRDCSARPLSGSAAHPARTEASMDGRRTFGAVDASSTRCCITPIGGLSRACHSGGALRNAVEHEGACPQETATFLVWRMWMPLQRMT